MCIPAAGKAWDLKPGVGSTAVESDADSHSMRTRGSCSVGSSANDEPEYVSTGVTLKLKVRGVVGSLLTMALVHGS